MLRDALDQSTLWSDSLSRVHIPPAPVDSVGTGMGIWAIEHPHALVIGIDLSPIQPTIIPPNVQFDIVDCSET
jgi:hypothetical protein